MIKFLYVVSLGITSFLLFIFSTEKDELVCNNQASGTITLITDSSGSYLGIVTEKDVILRPASINHGIVLAAGQRVTVCYNIDSTKLSPLQSTVPAHINSVIYNGN